MELKKYTKDGSLSYSFGAFPTYELLTKKAKYAKAIILHDKLETSDDINKIISLAQNLNIKIITNSKIIEKLSGKGNIYIMGVFEK